MRWLGLAVALLVAATAVSLARPLSKGEILIILGKNSSASGSSGAGCSGLALKFNAKCNSQYINTIL